MNIQSIGILNQYKKTTQNRSSDSPRTGRPSIISYFVIVSLSLKVFGPINVWENIKRITERRGKLYNEVT